MNNTRPCPTCNKPNDASATRCAACGRSLETVPPCPSCNASATVVLRDGMPCCSACGAERLDLAPSKAALRPAKLPWYKKGGVMRFAALGFATLSLLSGLSISFFMYLFRVGVVVSALPFAIGLLASSAAAFWAWGSHQRDSRRAQELHVLAAAARNNYVLTPTQLANDLRWDLKAADELLSSMADGSRVRVEVDMEHGLVSYVFEELRRGTENASPDFDALEDEESRSSQQGESQRRL